MKYYRVTFVPHGKEDKKWMMFQCYVPSNEK